MSHGRRKDDSLPIDILVASRSRIRTRLGSANRLGGNRIESGRSSIRRNRLGCERCWGFRSRPVGLSASPSDCRIVLPVLSRLLFGRRILRQRFSVSIGVGLRCSFVEIRCLCLQFLSSRCISTSFDRLCSCLLKSFRRDVGLF